MPWGWARGLRGRLSVALVLTSAVTLGVAALLVLSPLEQRLLREDVDSLTSTALTLRSSVAGLDPSVVHRRSPELVRLARAVRRRTGARVAVVDRRGRELVDTDRSRVPEPLPEAAAALARGSVVKRAVPRGGGAEGRVAVPVHAGPRSVAIVLRRPLTDVGGTVGVVRRAFLTAALVGLAIALALAIVFAGALLRRLRRLRDATGRLAVGSAHPVPADNRRDEVGELTRAFAAMQQRIRQEEEARDSFISTASHELRTPLTSLRGTLELLADDLADDRPDVDDARERVRRAIEQSVRLSSLASDLLDLSRIDAGVELRREPIELAELCRAVMAEFEGPAQARGAELEMRTTPGPCWALGDPGAVARIVRILLDNALRFSPSGKTVEVRLTDGSAPAVTVANSGPGVPPEDRERIFERFERGRNPDGVGGFGLGLPIGRKLAEQMGGRLRLDDGGSGASFTVMLEPTASASVTAGALRDPTRERSPLG